MKQFFSIRSRELTWRIVLITIVLSSFIFSALVYFQSRETLEASKKNIYVLVNDKSLVQAQATDITNSYNILSKGAVNHFNQLIFEHVPDTEQINKQLKTAISLSDKSTANLIDAYIQNGFYKSMIAQNYFTILKSDSISIDYSMNPHIFVFYGQLKIIRGSESSGRKIITKGNIQTSGRSSESNERGFYFSNFQLVADNPI